MHASVLGTFRLLPSFQDLGICQFVHFDTEGASGGSHICFFILPAPVGKVP